MYDLNLPIKNIIPAHRRNITQLRPCSLPDLNAHNQTRRAALCLLQHSGGKVILITRSGAAE